MACTKAEVNDKMGDPSLHTLRDQYEKIINHGLSTTGKRM